MRKRLINAEGRMQERRVGWIVKRKERMNGRAINGKCMKRREGRRRG